MEAAVFQARLCLHKSLWVWGFCFIAVATQATLSACCSSMKQKQKEHLAGKTGCSSVLLFCCSEFPCDTKADLNYGVGEREVCGGFLSCRRGKKHPAIHSSFLTRQRMRIQHRGLWDVGQRHQMLFVDPAYCCEMIQKSLLALQHQS